MKARNLITKTRHFYSSTESSSSGTIGTTIAPRQRPSNMQILADFKYNNSSSSKYLAWFPGDINSIKHVPLIPPDNYRTTIYDLKDLVTNKDTTPDRFFPSYSMIVEKSKSAVDRKRLELWRSRQIEMFGLEKFEQMSKDRMELGTNLHQMCYDYMETKKENLDVANTDVGPYWQSAKSALKQIDELKLTEVKLSHSVLCYKGVFDAVASYKNKLVLLEIKTSEKLKPTLDLAYEYPMQLAAYAGLVNYNPEMNLKITTGLVLICYPNEKESATLLYVDEKAMQKYWRKWLKRLQEFWAYENN